MKVRSTCKLYVYKFDGTELGYYNLLDNTVSIPLDVQMLAKSMFSSMPDALSKRGYWVLGEGEETVIIDGNGKESYRQVLQGYRGALKFKAVTTVSEI